VTTSLQPDPPAPGSPIRRRVLLVEDEPDVADTLRELIEREGFDVFVAGNGAEAIVALDRGEFQLVVSDLRMPSLTGPELYARLCEVRPDLVRAMAFVTGDTIGDNMSQFLRSCDRPLLEKPFTRAGIRAMLAGLVPADRAR
jgi:CheY-like chemotaxis protein